VRVIALALLVACTHAHGRGVDYAQADAMLDFLETPRAAQLEAVMAAPGTALIVAQQNVSRRITAAQYRTVLAAIGADRAPALAPADDSERAKRGVAGLRDDVWPALHWAAANRALLAARLADVRTLDAGAAATRLALAWLPDPTPPAVRLHVVMGGRAGAAAIDHDIYFDVLAMSFKASAGAGTYPSPPEIVEFFAHETHHVGLGAIVDRQRAQLRFDDVERRAYDLLVMLVSEGSATYFINAHHDLARMRDDPQYREHLADPERLLATIEHLLGELLAHRLDGDAYEQALTPLVASGFHSAGALLFDAIYRGSGRAAVLDVLRDPRQLLSAYVAAGGPHAFDRGLVARSVVLGVSGTGIADP